jgi:hypothetical protein
MTVGATNEVIEAFDWVTFQTKGAGETAEVWRCL